ncbi:ABC transporter permease [uncultured Brevundimonas sp.]|uniref:ABC transporter permease n=1 Tax=uncultured Brevundimonas sp. TaxID=213418 RepID=UPI0030EEF3C5|tara:strand:+ start:5757 stop:6881 length:1125 start_codon:yes stop_codon:yes gene_type:complete
MVSLSRTWAVMSKEFIQLTRDRLTYAMILIMPIVQLLLFGYAINNDPRQLPTAVLVQDRGVMARPVLNALTNTGYFRITVAANSQAELDRALARGDVQFAVVIPADFSRKVVRGQKASILVEADAADPSAVGGAVSALAGLPAQALARELTGPLARSGGAPPFEVVVHRRYNPENITAFNVVPGLLGIILSMTLVMMTALGMARERERGTMEALLATPVRPMEVMIGKLTPYVLVGVIQAALILVLARLLFAVPMSGGWLALSLGLLLFIVGSLALGFLISTVSRTQLQAMQMSFFYMMPSILLSGFMFPFRGMPEWAQVIGSIIPVTHVLRVARGSLLKGSGVMDSWPSLAALAAFLLAVGTLAMIRYRTTLD